MSSWLKGTSSTKNLPNIFCPLVRILNMLFKHSILSRDAKSLANMQKLAMKFLKGLRNVSYEADLQQLRLFSLTHQRIGGDQISMFKITRSLLEFPMESTVTHPTRKGLCGHEMLYPPSAIGFHHSGCPILEQTADLDSQIILVEIPQYTPGRPLQSLFNKVPI